MLINSDDRFKNNQGIINGRIVRLYLCDREEMKIYAKTLTESQRTIARDHLTTYIKVREEYFKVSAEERKKRRERRKLMESGF